MRNEREPLLAALAGFLVGVLFTLIVIQFSESTEWIYQLAILFALAIVAAAAVIAFLSLQRRQASSTNGMAPSQGPWVNNSLQIEPNPTTTGAPVSQGMASSVPLERRDRRSGELRENLPPQRGGRHGVEAASSLPSGRPVVKTFETPSSKRTDNDSIWQLDEQEIPDQTVYPRVSSSSTADPGRLVEVWESYRTRGDGKFTAHGLRQKLEAAGIAADVLPGEHVGAGDNLLGIEFRGGGPLYLLPNFNKPARAVSQWFQALGSESRAAVIQRLIRPATARRSGGGVNVETKGEIE